MDQTNDRTNRTQNPTVTGKEIGRICAHCGQRIPAGSYQGALIPDATVVDAHSRDVTVTAT